MAQLNGPHATAEEVAQAIEGLSDADWLRLRSAARSRLRGTRMGSPDDLINETLRRALVGERKWPEGVAFMVFFSNAMRSVANGIKRLSKQHKEVLAAEWDLQEDLAATPSVEDQAICNEKRKLAARDLETISAAFSSDEEVSWVLMGIEDGIKAEDVRTVAGMSPTQYETARKRLRRWLNSRFLARRPE